MFLVNKANKKETLATLRACRASLVDFRRLMLMNDPKTEIESAPFHHELSRLLLTGTQNEAMEWYRESAKTQFVARAFPLYALAYPNSARDYIVIIQNTSKLAQGKLRAIEKEYMESPMLNCRLIEVNEQSANAFDITVENDDGKPHQVRIEAYGKGASIRGLSQKDRRPKILALDDLQDTEDTKSNKIMEDDWNWFLSDIKFLADRCRVFMIGNNLGEKCIIERVAKNAEELNFHFTRIGVADSSGNPTWPAQTTAAKIQEEKDAYRRMGKLDIWLREKMCVAVDEETRLFQRRDFRYYEPQLKDHITRSCNVFAAFDPAAGMGDGSDFRAMVVVGVDNENRWYVLDIAYGRFDPMKCIDEMFRLVLNYKHQLKKFGIEKGALKSVYEPFIIDEQRKRNIFFTTCDLEARTKKVERIKLLQPRFRSHSILFPRDAAFLTELEAELEAISSDGTTKGEHDDLIDALAYIEQIAYQPTSQVVDPTNLPRRARSSGG